MPATRRRTKARRSRGRDAASNEGKACRGIDRWSRAWPGPTETFAHGCKRWMHHDLVGAGHARDAAVNEGKA